MLKASSCLSRGCRYLKAPCSGRCLEASGHAATLVFGACVARALVTFLVEFSAAKKEFVCRFKGLNDSVQGVLLRRWHWLRQWWCLRFWRRLRDGEVLQQERRL